MEKATQDSKRRSVWLVVGIAAACVLAIAVLVPRIYHWGLQAPADGRERAVSAMDDAFESARVEDPGFQAPENLVVQDLRWLVDFTGWPFGVPSDEGWAPCRTALVFDGDSPYLVIGEGHYGDGISYTGAGNWARALDGLIDADDEVVFAKASDGIFAVNLTDGKVYALEDTSLFEASAYQADSATSAWLLLAVRLFGY